MNQVVSFIRNLLGAEKAKQNSGLDGYLNTPKPTSKPDYVFTADPTPKPQNPQINLSSADKAEQQKQLSLQAPQGPKNRQAPPQYEDMILKAAQQYNIIPQHFINLLARESINFRPDVVDGRLKSPAGAMGVAQFMPQTVKEVTRLRGKSFDPYNPQEAIDASAFYLRHLMDQYGFTPAEAYAAYNGGQGHVLNARKQGGFNQHMRNPGLFPEETFNYVPAVLGYDSYDDYLRDYVDY